MATGGSQGKHEPTLQPLTSAEELTFVCLDFETSEPPERPKIIQVGCVLIRNDQVVGRFDELASLGRELTETERSLTKVTDADLVFSTPIGTVLRRLFYWLSTNVNGKLLAVTCGDHDLGPIFEAACFWARVRRPAYLRSWINVKHVVVPQVFQKKHSLYELAMQYGVQYSGAHARNALYDAEVLSQVWRTMITRGAGLWTTSRFVHSTKACVMRFPDGATVDWTTKVVIYHDDVGAQFLTAGPSRRLIMAPMSWGIESLCAKHSTSGLIISGTQILMDAGVMPDPERDYVDRDYHDRVRRLFALAPENKFVFWSGRPEPGDLTVYLEERPGAFIGRYRPSRASIDRERSAYEHGYNYSADEFSEWISDGTFEHRIRDLHASFPMTGDVRRSRLVSLEQAVDMTDAQLHELFEGDPV